MKKVLIALALISIFSLGISSSADAAIKPGSKCKTKNEVAYSGNVKFTCVKSGSKLLWNKGILITNNSQQSTNASSNGDEIESLPIDPKAPLNVDLKGAGQGKGLTYVPFGIDTGPRGEGAIGSGTMNPQPGLYAPLGTDVLAIKTGTIIRITKRHTPGIGLVEFGLLINSSGPPTHICPFKKIAQSAKSRITAELTAIIAADKKRGYDSGPMEVIGCTALVSVEG